MMQYSIPLTYLKGSCFSQKEGAENDYTHAPRPLYSFGYIKRGGARFVCCGQEHLLCAGDIVFVPKGCRYHSLWTGGEETDVVCFHFDLVPFGEPVGNRIYPMQKIAGEGKLLSMFEELALAKESPYDSLLSLGRFFELLVMLFQKMRYDTCPSINERILLALRYIEEHYDAPLRVADLAELCHISTSYFYECFKREMGVSPIEYKNQIMIRHAERTLIDSPDVSIEALGERLGFESSVYFRRLFKAKTGMSPRDYRKRGGREF